MSQAVLYSTEGRVAEIILNRPQSRNALTGEEMMFDLIAALEAADRHPDLGVLIITGNGPAFSAGGDVKAMAGRTGLFAGNPAEITEGYRASIQRLTRLLLTTDLVTIAAVNGPAIGAGFDLVMGCDLRLGSPTARFAHTFVELGIIPGDGGAWLLPRVVGWQRAAELAFTSRQVEAEEAVALGILLEIVPDDELTTRARTLARQIASKPATSVKLTKRLLRHARGMDLEGFLDLSAAFQAIAHHTPDHPQAVEAYLQALKESRAQGSPGGA